MYNLGSGQDTPVFVPPSLPQLEMRLLNNITVLQSPWEIPFGKTTCFVHLAQQSLYITEKVFLRFQCEKDVIQISLDDFSILWLHPAMEFVQYNTQLPDVIMLSIFEALFKPLKQRLQNIVHNSIKFLGLFYEPLMDYPFGCTVTFILESPKLEELKQHTGIPRSVVSFKVYIPVSECIDVFLNYLITLPKKYISLSFLPVTLNIRAGYCSLTLNQISKLSKGDILFPDDYPVVRNKVSLVFLDQEIPCIVEGKQIKISGWDKTIAFPKKFPDAWRLEHIKGTNIPLTLTVSFEIGRYITTIGNIAQFGEGTTLRADINFNAPISLCIHNRVIGKGEIIQFNGLIGMRIVELLRVVDSK